MSQRSVRDQSASVSRQSVLNEAERAECELVARRLHAELRAAQTLLPEEERGASAMSRAFKLDRATCQRIVGSTSSTEVTAEFLVRAPGIMGLRQFLTAISARLRAGGHGEQIAALASAIDRFERLLGTVGGSQRRLKAKMGLESRQPVPGLDPYSGGAEDGYAREALYHAAAAVTGRWSETITDIRVIAPFGADPRLNDGLRIRGTFGHESRIDAVPLEIGVAKPLRAPSASGDPAFNSLAGDGSHALLTEFCSTPLPRLTTRSAGERVLNVVDTVDGTSDIVLAHRISRPDPHPATLRPALGEVWFLPTFPARRMVFDVFLHRDIAAKCSASLQLHLWGPDLLNHGSSRWSTRFPGGPRLEELGTGLDGAATPSYARHRELLERVFGEAGWNPAEFAGYRCETLYPVWRAGYGMIFDFTGHELPPTA